MRMFRIKKMNSLFDENYVDRKTIFPYKKNSS